MNPFIFGALLVFSVVFGTSQVLGTVVTLQGPGFVAWLGSVYFPGFLATFLAPALAAFMTRQSEGNTHAGDLNWAGGVWALPTAAIFYWPYAAEWWLLPDPKWIALGLFSQIGVFVLFMVLAPKPNLPPGGFFWGFMTAMGGLAIRAGMYYTVHRALGLVDALYISLALTILFMVTAGFTTLLMFRGLVGVTAMGARRQVFVRLTQPNSDQPAVGAVLAIGEGTSVNRFIADFTGVPRPEESLPVALTNANHDRIWRWMLGVDRNGRPLDPSDFPLERRADPRWFCIGYAKLMPALVYPGVPGLTVVVDWKGFPEFGGKFATLQEMPDVNFKKGPFPTGIGPELTVTLGITLRLVNPYAVWRTIDWRKSVDHLTEIYIPLVVKVIGPDLWVRGVGGVSSVDAVMPDAFALDRPYTPHEPSLINPNDQMLVPDVDANGIQLVDDAGRPRTKLVRRVLQAHEGVALLRQAYRLAIALKTGILVTEDYIKDVDGPDTLDQAADEALRVNARHILTLANTDAARAAAGATIEALLDAADKYGMNDEKKGEMLLKAAEFFFFNGGDAGGALAAFMVKKS